MALPWKDVNARDSQVVAERIGLPKRERSERRKWGCPFCGSSDGLHAYPGVGAGFGCWAACGADQPRLCRGYSAVDVAARHWAISPAEACRRLAVEFGIVYEETRDVRPRRHRPWPREPAPRRPRASDQEANLAAVRALPGARLPSAVYADVLQHLHLTFRGERYLASRRLDADAARAYGYRSVDGWTEWEALARRLEAGFRVEELAAAGFPRTGDPAAPVVLPFNGRLPAVLIPFWRGGEVVGIRFRNVLPDDRRYKHNRYRTLAAASPPWPYNGDALHAATVHICEGELNAETLRQLGHDAAGVYSAGAWLEHWTAELAGARRIVDWHDCGDAKHAGDIGAAALRARLVASFGEEWVAERWRRMITDADPNALHQRERLAAILRAEPWEEASAADVHADSGPAAYGP